MRMSLNLSSDAIRDARLLTGREDAAEAIELLVRSHGRLIADLRKARNRLDQLEAGSLELERLEQRLLEVARTVLEELG